MQKMSSIISRPAKNVLKRRPLSKGRGVLSWGLGPAAGPSPGTPTPTSRRLPPRAAFPVPVSPRVAL